MSSSNLVQTIAHASLLPAGWHSAMDPMTGRIYFSNPSTGQSSWESPVLVAPKWSSSGFLDTSSSSAFVDTSVPVSPVLEGYNIVTTSPVHDCSIGATTATTTTESHKEIRERIRQRLLQLDTEKCCWSDDKIEMALVRLDCVKAVAFHQSSEDEILNTCLKEGNSTTKRTAARRRERRQQNRHY